MVQQTDVNHLRMLFIGGEIDNQAQRASPKKGQHLGEQRVPGLLGLNTLIA
ncbi:hypothetical protein [Ktedonobacter racemifer]|uniref:hypothetical protein n=1 Tax=Ktedonobacter racemifer TaxID=363277 RepID=UPI0012FCC0FC|nr:hypothetical protein [Ktedonobacter racemifer]